MTATLAGCAGGGAGGGGPAGFPIVRRNRPLRSGLYAMIANDTHLAPVLANQPSCSPQVDKVAQRQAGTLIRSWLEEVLKHQAQSVCG